MEQITELLQNPINLLLKDRVFNLLPDIFLLVPCLVAHYLLHLLVINKPFKQKRTQLSLPDVQVLDDPPPHFVVLKNTFLIVFKSFFLFGYYCLLLELCFLILVGRGLSDKKEGAVRVSCDPRVIPE